MSPRWCDREWKNKKYFIISTFTGIQGGNLDEICWWSEYHLSLLPDIIGNVFEKTINVITSNPTSNKRKEQGAYYTPNHITEFISSETIKSYLYEKIIQYLRDKQWKAAELSDYENFDVLLGNLTKNPKTVREIYEKIVKKIYILDPAVGSGHFLRDALILLLRIHTVFLHTLKEQVQPYDLKKHIITNNIFRVDIDKNAVEIAKLRLWLSLIENLDVHNKEELQALPNIEYNIKCGNSLIGLYNPIFERRLLLNSINSSPLNYLKKIQENWCKNFWIIF